MNKKHPYKKIVLPNKLTVLIYEIDSVMSTHAVLYVRAGAIYEKKKERGVSHFTEHVAFLGNKKYPTPLALSQAAQNIGAKYNGWTDRFSTRYWISLPYLNVNEGLEFLYQLVFEPIIRSSDVKRERNVVLSEYNDFWHNPERKFYHEKWRKRFKQKEHPYSYRSLGIPKTIKAINKKAIIDWRKKYYSPANMVLSISGNTDKKSINNIIKSNFSTINQGIKRKEPKFSTNDYSSFSTYYQKEDRPQITFSISYPLFGWKQVERNKRLQLYFINHIFGGSSASRLFQRVREKERLVYRIRSDVNLHTWMGAFIINGSVSVDNLIKAMKAIKSEITKYKKYGATKKEVGLSRKYFDASVLMEFDNPQSIAYYLGHQVFNEEEVWFPEDYIKEYKKIKNNDLGKMIKEIFNYSKTNISLMGNVSNKLLKEVENIFS